MEVLTNKVSIKLINCTILMTLIYLLYKTMNLWIGFGSKIFEILLPFLLSFVIAYTLYPVVRFLQCRNIPKIVTIIILVVLILSVLISFIIFFIPVLFEQIINLITLLITFLTELSIKYNFDFESIQTLLDSSFDKLSVIATTGVYRFVMASINYVTLFFIIIISSFYFLIDFDKIRLFIYDKFNTNVLKYLYIINVEMRNYFNSFMKIGIISFFEYGIAFLIIGHPNFLLLGILSGMLGIIPYFGGLFACIIGLITASVIGFDLFIRAFILFVVLSQVDGFIINPLIYNKSNHIHPLLVIFSIFMGGSILGVFGIIISLPLMIILIATIRYFKCDINDIILNVRDKETIRSGKYDSKTKRYL